MRSDLNNAKPFIRWPGGKRWLIPTVLKEIGNIVPKRYIEPFLGGGAIFFSTSFPKCILSDLNVELVNAYEQVRDNPMKLIDKLKKYPINKAFYDEIKNKKYSSPISKAARFLYLNRTAFSGIYRTNLNGEYNVPYGGGSRTQKILWEQNLIINASKQLQNKILICSDFEAIIKKANNGDIVYCDPTYTVRHNNNGFRRYNEKIFSWEDQIRLAKCCNNAVSKGAIVIVSNAFHKEVSELYKGFTHIRVERPSMLSVDPVFRTKTVESLFISK